MGVIRSRSLASFATAGRPVIHEGGGGGWDPPYGLPSAGQALNIATNTVASTAPNEWGSGTWNYCNFGSYGGGVLNPYYGDGGAYFFGPSGGHNHPDNPGMLVFDFNDASWKRLDNANGAPRNPTPPYALEDSLTNGSPWYEYNDYAEVPGPPHPYAHHIAVDEGDAGSIITVIRAGVAVGSYMSARTHRFDCDTRLWSRWTTNAAPWAAVEGDAVLDAARNRIWLVRSDAHSVQHVNYMDLADNKTWKTVTFSDWPPVGVGSTFSRVVLHEGMLVRNCGPTYGLYLFDPDSPASTGWQQLTVSGTLPAPINRWAPYNGKWWSLPDTGGSSITRITPPANPKTGTWTVDSVSLSGDTPLGSADGSDGYYHYTRLCYVPSIDCLAWVPGMDSGVWIIRPE